MPSDEFGREVPYVNIQQRATSPHLLHPDHHPHYEHHSSYHMNDTDESRRAHRRDDHSPEPRKRTAPYNQYVDEPMICQYIWKKHQEDRGEQDNNVIETYDEYRQRYCLKYIREFFNQHLDDSWFRNRFSPLARKRLVLQNCERSAAEAREFATQLAAAPSHFVVQARLGSGVKDRSLSSSVGEKRKQDESYSSFPASHVLSIWDRFVRLSDIPPHVSEKQIILALLDHSTEAHAQIQIFSEAVKVNDEEAPLYRAAVCVFENAEVKKDIISNIQKKAASDEVGSHVPRKDGRKGIGLDVECADPYGRFEVEDEAGGTVPHRKATISLSLAEPNQKVVVLSAGLSLMTRISKDKEAALILARALDVKHKIPDECRLDNLIQLLEYDDADVLDVSIAYLRRVHLFSFYNGCVFSDNLADVLNGNHQASTIHLRLRNAEEFLPQGDMENSTDGKTDLLVRRLDESIRKGLENAVGWATNYCFVNPEVDAEALEIEELEKQSELDWVQQHSIDEDGRARCGFHFCRKLFREMSFLEKHLYKKHQEFLLAEIAKCHDSYMMSAWDRDEVRPVPPILVDCGKSFGLVASPVIGASTPMAEDPEPMLWEKHRRPDERETQRDYHRHRHRQSRDYDGGEGDGPTNGHLPNRNNFEDVDDMKEEKVELSFENVDVPVQPPKKKKKKKLL